MGDGPRYFVEGLSARPFDGWVPVLSDLGALAERDGMGAADVGIGDAEALRQAVPEVMAVQGMLLDRVKARQLALASCDEELGSARIGGI